MASGSIDDAAGATGDSTARASTEELLRDEVWVGGELEPGRGLQPADERRVMGRMAGWLYVLSGLVLAAGLLMPGTGREHVPVVIGFALYVIAFGVGSLTDWIPWSRAPMWQHQLAGVAVMPVCGVVLWATGGASSYALPLMILPLFFFSYFYRPAWAWGLVALLVATTATPLAYDPDASEAAYPARWLAIAVASFTLTAAVLWLKGRLVGAERRQRAMALRDSLTGLGNRRAFDAALQAEVVRAGEIEPERVPVPSALLFVDLDRFKEVNDAYGHQAGDRVLREVAERCNAVVRPGDTIARIGGDEFAIIAPRAGRQGAARMAEALERAVRRVVPARGSDPITATVSFALLGADGRNATELMRAVDRRLHDLKHRRGSGEEDATASEPSGEVASAASRPRPGGLPPP